MGGAAKAEVTRGSAEARAAPDGAGHGTADDRAVPAPDYRVLIEIQRCDYAENEGDDRSGVTYAARAACCAPAGGRDRDGGRACGAGRSAKARSV